VQNAKSKEQRTKGKGQRAKHKKIENREIARFLHPDSESVSGKTGKQKTVKELCAGMGDLAN
jgi:hypothetical protein